MSAIAGRLLGRLLDDLGVARLQPREGAVEVGGGQEDAGVGGGDVQRRVRVLVTRERLVPIDDPA